MKHDWPPYPKYSPSELLWQPQIPTHWSVLRNGRVFGERTDTGYPDLPILEVSLRTGITVRDMANLKRKQMMSQREKYKRAQQGDIAYNMMRMWQGAVGVAPIDGLVSPAYVVARPNKGTDSHYFNYLFRTNLYKAEINKYSRGIVADRNRLYWDGFKQMPAIVPPLDEQTHIATFLREQDRQVAQFIRGKRRLMELLNEQKHIIIHQAMTRGLDPDVSLKPTDADWLGDIPAHWVVLKLKAVATFNPSRSERDQHRFSSEPTTFVPMECVSNDGRLLNPQTVPIEQYWEGYTYFRKGDVVVAKITPCFENGKGACLDELSTPFGFGTTEFVVLRARSQVLPKFLYQLTALRIFRRLGAREMTGSAGQKRVPLDFIKNFPAPLPPLAEQQTLLEFIAREEARFQEAIRQTTAEIKLVLEYRNRLISDIVTGQLDVRGWQPPALNLEANAEVTQEIAAAEEVDDAEETDTVEVDGYDGHD